MALTKEELQKHIDDETALIAKLQQDAEEAFKQLSANANNQA